MRTRILEYDPASGSTTALEGIDQARPGVRAVMPIELDRREAARQLRELASQLEAAPDQAVLAAIARAAAPKWCPICGSRAVSRTGQHGRFIGCSAFPRCRWSTSEPHLESAQAYAGDRPHTERDRR